MQKKSVGESQDGGAGAMSLGQNWSEMSFQDVVDNAERLRDEGLLEKNNFFWRAIGAV